jgi:hypothetical protein
MFSIKRIPKYLNFFFSKHKLGFKFQPKILSGLPKQYFTTIITRPFRNANLIIIQPVYTFIYCTLFKKNLREV